MTTREWFRLLRAEAFRSGIPEVEIHFRLDTTSSAEQILVIPSEVDLFHAVNATRIVEVPPPAEYVHMPYIKWYRQELRFPAAEAYLRRRKPLPLHVSASITK